MDNTDIYLEYLESHIVRKITVGKSGADVYELDGERVAKYVRRKSLNNDSMWNAYVRESMFFSSYSGKDYSFIPEVFQNICNSDEILIIMKKYRPVVRDDINDILLEKILAALAKVHTLKIPEFITIGSVEPVFFDSEALLECINGWQSVLSEHGDFFADHKLKEIYENINQINACFYDSQLKFNHGDFHCDNVMVDDEENIVICDWQNCSVGNVSGDISFFLSRLSAGGCQFDNKKVIQAYCRCAKEIGVDVDEREIDIQMRLANLNTTFRFWHIYLHGASVCQVRDIYKKMIEDMQVLLEIMDNTLVHKK